ncbi:MAG TPA: aminotransferase class III-fold pyridoxal phosphate-dependent enzyme, partial [Geminicoccaceae bacterium]|nr:aminotransferase class III-fold pyridoxal phosphate-dependent enzyme [Geminicoccaceae bacterium]
GRTGRFHSFEAEGVVPDVIAYGKALGGGLPLSAAVGPAPVMNDPRGLTITTTAGNPVSTAAGRAVLRTIMAEKLMDNATARGEELVQGLRQLANKQPVIGDVRGRGLVIGVDLVYDRQSKEPAGRFCAKVAYRARELGAAVFYVGQHSNVLELTPPITLSSAEAQEGLQILDQALTDVANDRVPDAALAGYGGW